MLHAAINKLRVGNQPIRIQVATQGGSPIVSTYVMAGPASGTAGQASGNFTVTLGSGTLASPVVITPSDGGAGGTFTPLTVSLTNSTRSGTFTYTAAAAGTYTISTTNNGGLNDPLGAIYVASPASAITYSLTGPPSGTTGLASSAFTITLGGGTLTGSVTVTPSDGASGGTFSPTSITLTNGSRSGTFTYTAASAGAVNISVTNNGGLPNPAPAAFVSASGSTASYTLSGPTGGLANQASAAFTVALGGGTLSGSVTITPADGGHGGAFSPTSVTLTNSARSATFTYTAGTSGAVTIATTNSSTLTNPSSLAYSAMSLVMVDSTWLTSNATTYGGPPYVLDTANRYYQLATDVTTNGTAFVVVANGITLDLNGHSVTFGNLANFGLPLNGGFESGSGTSVPNWDFTAAPSAVICNAADHYLFGSQALRFNAPTGAQVITSDSFSLPASIVGFPCMAVCTPSWPNTSSAGTLLLEVVNGSRSSPGSTVGTFSNTHALDRGSMCTAAFTPASTGPFFIRITWTPPSSGVSLDIDAVKINAAYNYGVVATSEWPGGTPPPDFYTAFPSGVQTVYAADYSHIHSFALTNSSPGTGGVFSGSQASYGGGLIRSQYLTSSVVVTNIAFTANGDDLVGGIVAGGSSATTTVSGCSFTYSGCDNSDHYVVRGVVLVSSSTGAASVTNNTFTGFPQHGVAVSNCTPGPSIITGNTFTNNSMVADAYAMMIAGAANVLLANNTVTTTNGYGFGLDQYATTAFPETVEVCGNTVSQAVLPNRESGNAGVNYCMKHRNTSGGATYALISCKIHDNAFTSNVNAGGMLTGVGIFFSHADNNGQNLGNGSLVWNNTLTCIVNPASTSYIGTALNVYNLTAGVHPGFWNNILTSNDTCLWISGPNDNAISGLTVMGNTYVKSALGDQTRTHYSLKGGYANNGSIASTYVFDPVFSGGAALNVNLAGSAAKSIGVGYTAGAHVQQSGGSAVSGATVTLTNAAGAGGGAATAFAGINAASRTYPSSSNTGTTDGSGNWSNVSMVTDIFSGTTSASHTVDSPLHFAAVSGALSGSADATPTTGGTTTITVS